MEGWFDGGSRGNPGVAGAGWILKRLNGSVVQAGYVFVGDSSTNNQAEYAGLIALLEAACSFECKQLNVYGDSLLVIQQMQGNWQVKDSKMRALHSKAAQLCSNIDQITFTHVLRHRNSEADMLSNMAMDTKSSRIGVDLIKSDVISTYSGPTCSVRIRREHGQVVQGCDVWMGAAWTKGGWKLTRSEWCNPFGHLPASLAAYKKYIAGQPGLVARIFTELKGRRLGCFCEPDDPNCHAAWLAAVAEDPTLLLKN